MDKPIDPFDIDIERPDEHTPQGDEIYCWMPGNGDQACGGHCVSYEPGCLDDQRLSSCMALNAIRSIAHGVNVMAKAQSRTKDAVAREVQRANEPVPPEVNS